MLHLAIFSPGYIDKIFTGRKTLESRFSKIRCEPFGSVEEGDLVLMKKSGGPIVGYFVAGAVTFYEPVSPERLRGIVQRYWDNLAITEEFLMARRDSKYLTIIEITKPTRFRFPVVVKKKSLHGWVGLGGESQRQIQLF